MQTIIDLITLSLISIMSGSIVALAVIIILH